MIPRQSATHRSEQVVATPIQSEESHKQFVLRRPSFEESYNQTISAGGVIPEISGVSRQIVVNFRNPDAVDKNPNADEPLVADNNGFLMIFWSNNLPSDQAYLAPSLEFEGKWTNTHARKWRGLFEFSGNDANRLERAAIVQQRGDEYLVFQKGRIS